MGKMKNLLVFVVCAIAEVLQAEARVRSAKGLDRVHSGTQSLRWLVS